MKGPLFFLLLYCPLVVDTNKSIVCYTTGVLSKWPITNMYESVYLRIEVEPNNRSSIIHEYLGFLVHQFYCIYWCIVNIDLKLGYKLPPTDPFSRNLCKKFRKPNVMTWYTTFLLWKMVRVVVWPKLRRSHWT